MELRQLKYFLGIAETGRFSDASKQMFISQSAVSQQIKLLEEELGTQLFVRNANGVSLTEAGQHLLPLAKRVLQGITACYNCISDLKGLLCGELNVGLTYTLEPYVRESTLQFMRAYPKVQLNAHYKNLSELLHKLREREIDMMLSMMPTSAHDFVESVPITSYRLCAIMRRNHPLASKDVLTFSDFQHHGIILPEKGIRDRNAIESYIHTDTGKLNIRSLVNDANAILNILQESNYISFLAEHTITNRPSLCAIPIAELDKPIQIYAHFNREAARKHSAEVFLDILHQTARNYDFMHSS